MYQCNVRFYMVGLKESGIIEIIKSMPPMENFSHYFVEGETADKAVAAGSDVIFAYIGDSGAKKTLSSLTRYKGDRKSVV